MKRRIADGGCGGMLGAVNKRVERAWLDLWARCSIMVRHGLLESDISAHLPSRMRRPKYHSQYTVGGASSLFARVDADLARGHPRLLRTESRSVVVDRCCASWHARQLLFNHLGGILHWLVTYFFHVPLALMSKPKANYTLEFSLAL